MSFDAMLSVSDAVALIRLNGELDARTAAMFRDEVKRAAGHDCAHLVLDVSGVTYLSSAGLRTLAYARQKLPAHVRIVMVGANDTIQRTIRLVGFQYNVEFDGPVPGLTGREEIYFDETFDPPVV